MFELLGFVTALAGLYAAEIFGMRWLNRRVPWYTGCPWWHHPLWVVLLVVAFVVPPCLLAAVA